MFLEEARVSTRIEHINVATVFELGAANETYWIAMEHVHGVSTRDIAMHNQALGIAMPPELACRVIADIQAELAYGRRIAGDIQRLRP